MRQLLFFLLTISISVNLHAQTNASQVVPGLVVVKIDENLQGRGGNAGRSLNLDRLNALSAVQSVQSVASLSKNQSRLGTSILSGIYKIQISEDESIAEMIEYFNSFPNVIYAEPYQNVQPLLVPNDPQATIGAEQYYLEQIRAYQAWDISQGSEDIVIGILDTGTDLDHQDLQSNLYLNEADPIDGIDNDLDGYVDNYYGWDFADGDNDPTADASAHGTGVSGIAAAATNNAVGMAGMGFNTKFMPIKIFSSTDGFSRNSYEAIIYAADQGCDVINLSWGGIGFYSQYAQDIINYAVLERDVVVVAAAGNTNAELEFYPASYQNVLSVSWVNANDERDPNATYSDFVDLVAPGVSIFTSQNGDNYHKDSGSSYAAPLVAGTAALIRAVHPEWNARQVMEQLRVSTNDIYDISANQPFEFKLGKGRLNAFRALADYNSPAVRLANFSYTNGIEEAAYFGDTLRISATFENLLSSASSIEVQLESSSPFVSILKSDFFIENLGTLQMQGNESDLFLVVLSNDLPENETLNFRLRFEGESYSDYQAFQIQSSPAQRIFTFQDWQFGYSASGNLGRNQQNPFNDFVVRFNDSPQLNHLGYAIVSTDGRIAKNTTVNPLENSFSQSFQTLDRLKRFDDMTADLDIRNAYEEADTIANPLNIAIEQRLLGWNDAPNALLLNYRVINQGTEAYDSLYFQLFADYFVEEYSSNQVQYDNSNQMVYARNNTEDQYFGLAILGSHDTLFNALDLANLNAHTSDLDNDTLTNAILFDQISNPFNKLQAGSLQGGNNVGSLSGILMKNLGSKAVYTFEVAMIAGNSLVDLQNTLFDIQNKSIEAKMRPPLGKIQQVCLNDEPIINAEAGESWEIFEHPLDETPIEQGTVFTPGIITKDTVFYRVVTTQEGIQKRMDRLEIIITEAKADFSVPADPLLLQEGGQVSYRFIDQSNLAVNWEWNFSNGFQSTNQNPIISFNQEGTYTVELTVSNEIGCSQTISKQVEVVLQGKKPNIAGQSICKNSTVQFSDQQIGEITVYSDSLLSEQIYQGAEFVSMPIGENTVFYVRNEQQTYPSEVEKVSVEVSRLKASFDITHNANIERAEEGIILRNTSLYEQSIEWFLGQQSKGTSNEIQISPLQLRNEAIVLVAYGENNCTDSVIWSGSQSVAPTFPEYFVCDQQEILISAGNSSEVYYYADSALENFLGSGQSLRLSELTDSTKVYAFNAEFFSPSEIVEVPLVISEVDASFSSSADTINIAYQDEINFEAAVRNQGLSYDWDFGNGDTANVPVTTAKFNEAGVYVVRLMVQDSLGCRKEEETTIVALNDPFLGNTDDIKSFFRIYPNPAKNFITLEASKDFVFDSYTVKNLRGQELIKSESIKPIQQAEVINIEELNTGSYLLTVKKGEKEATFVFIKR